MIGLYSNSISVLLLCKVEAKDGATAAKKGSRAWIVICIRNNSKTLCLLLDYSLYCAVERTYLERWELVLLRALPLTGSAKNPSVMVRFLCIPSSRYSIDSIYYFCTVFHIMLYKSAIVKCFISYRVCASLSWRVFYVGGIVKDKAPEAGDGVWSRRGPAVPSGGGPPASSPNTK